MSYKSEKIIQQIEALDVPSYNLWVAEAKFGFRYVKKKVKELPLSSSILEVGCGSGILLSMLVEDFPSNNFDGIEPFVDGFSSLREINLLVQNKGVKIKNCGYENCLISKKYDLIYCVNVFEHIKDWKNFLVWISERLTDDGLFFMLCPNYSFPYESHFRIPILLNKKITYRLFKNYIDKFEEVNDSVGLWASLNFVKKRDIKKFIYNRKELCLKLSDEVEVIDDMVNRITDDVEFRKRQAFIGSIAIFLKKIGIFNVVKLFPNFLPYMKISIRKTNSMT